MIGSKGIVVVAVPVALVLAVALIALACFPASSRGAELVGEPDPPPQGEVVPAEEQYAVHDRHPARGQYDPDTPYPSDWGTYDDPCPVCSLADGAEPAAEDAHNAGEALGNAREATAAEPPDAPATSYCGTYENPCPAGGDGGAVAESAAEDAQNADDALVEAHEATAATRKPQAQTPEIPGAAAPGSRTAEVDSGARNDPATPYPSDVAEPAARDAQGTDAAPDEARQITASVPFTAAPPVADPAGPTVLDAGGTERAPERVREGSGEPEAEHVVREPLPHAPQPLVDLPLSTADPVDPTANQEAYDAAAGHSDADAPAPKEPLVVPARGPPEEAGPKTEEPEARPVATREAAPEQRAFLAPESPRKAAAAEATLSTVPLSATGGSLLLALGAGALIYRRRFGR